MRCFNGDLLLHVQHMNVQPKLLQQAQRFQEPTRYLNDVTWHKLATPKPRPSLYLAPFSKAIDILPGSFGKSSSRQQISFQQAQRVQKPARKFATQRHLSHISKNCLSVHRSPVCVSTRAKMKSAPSWTSWGCQWIQQSSSPHVLFKMGRLGPQPFHWSLQASSLWSGESEAWKVASICKSIIYKGMDLRILSSMFACHWVDLPSHSNQMLLSTQILLGSF